MDAKSRLLLKLNAIEAAARDDDISHLVDSCRRALGRVDDEHQAELGRLQSVLATVMQEQPLVAWVGLASRLEGAAERIESAVNLASKAVPIVTESAPVLERVA